MSYDVAQFRDLIERTLIRLDPDLAAPVAIDLLLGTAAQESGFGRYMKQLNGPALGAFQMEPATFEWLQVKYDDKYPELVGRYAKEMEWDLRLAIVMARLRYRAVPLPLPDGGIETLAAYYKRHFNTPLGKATEEEFMANYRKYGLAVV